MINDLQEVQWAYLLDPAFELINTAGKPLTDGYIEVYIHGTRNKYYCASDFDGTLHPFKIPLDALGANIVLASPAHSYDIYVYNKFGSLVMSRYNIQPKTGSGEIVHDDITVSSNDGSVHIVTSGQTNYDLSIQDTIDRVDIVESNITNLATSIEEISNVVTGHDVDIEELKANKKDKQEEYVAIGGPTKTITKVEQDEDGKMSVVYEDIALPQEVPNVEITSPNGTINIASSIDIATNTKTFEIDVDGHEPDWHYWTGNNAWTTITTSAWKDINRPTMGAGKAPHSWTPEVKLGVYDAKADFTVTFHNQDNSYTVPNQIIQIGFRAKLVGKNNADAIRYVDLGAWTYDPSLYTTEPYQYNFAQESLRQNYSTSKILYVPTYAGDTEFYIYYQAALLNTDGGVGTPQSIDPVCRAEITYFGYHEVVGAVNGNSSSNLMPGSGIDIDEDIINVNIGEGLTIINNNVSIDKSVVLAKDNLVAGDNITITASGDNLIISSDADVSELATKDELASAVDDLQEQIDNISAQVQSDWTEDDVDDPAYIQHKPVEKALVAGDNITITDIGSAIEISSAGGGASGTTYSAGDGIDITNDVISVDNSIARASDLANLATKAELEEYIPYSASGVELPNSNFEIRADGQAYKTHDTTVTTEYAITPAASGGYVTGNITISNGSTLVITGCKPYAVVAPTNIIAQNANSEGVATFNATETFTVDTLTIWQFDITEEQEESITDGTLTITQSGAIVKERYVLESELGSAIDELQDEINNIPAQTTYTGANGVNVDNDTISLDDPIGVIAGQGITFTTAGDEIIISANIDSSTLATKDELASAIDSVEAEIPTYVAGQGITFTASGDDVIISSSDSGSTYTAGVGITIDNDVLNVDTSVIAPISAIPEDKVIKLEYDHNASWNTATIESWAQSKKLVYLFVPARSYFPSRDVPEDLFIANNCWLRLTSTPMNADMPNTLVVFSGVLRDGQNDPTNSYHVALMYNKSKVIGNRWSCSYSKVLTSSDIPDTSSFATNTELASAIDIVEAEIPTTTSDLQNDSGFVTTTELASAIPDLDDLNTAGITDIQIVNALPASPVATVLYLVRE